MKLYNYRNSYKIYILLSHRYATWNAAYRTWWSTDGTTWHERPTSRFDAWWPTSPILAGLLRNFIII